MRNPTNISNILLYVALIFLIAWAIGFLSYNAGGIVHVLLVIAIIALILRFIRSSRLF